MNRFIYYIVCAFFVFNGVAGKAEEFADLPDKEPPVAEDFVEYRVYNRLVSDSRWQNAGKHPSSVIQSQSSLARIVLLPFVVDKVFDGNRINDDMLWFLKMVYPETDEEKLKGLEEPLRYIVGWKRKYDKVVAHLKHKIKAASLLPEDSPVIAASGEFAPAETDLYKQSAEGDYMISYRPYKYLEYDPGRFGEAVRHRDKNYMSTDEFNTDELILAMLRLDIGGFVKALQKMPAYNDGSAEKAVKTANGVKARLLLDMAHPGDKKNIYGALQICIPEGMYIKGDFMNPTARASFILREQGAVPDERGSTNISSFRLYFPLANGIEKDGETRRVLTGCVRFPMEFSRRDTTKSMRIAGDFLFMLCSADGNCKTEKTKHELTLKASEREEVSAYSNYVTQGFTHLPLQETNHIRPHRLIYNPQTQKLTAEFQISKTFSSMAAMAEDASGTNFLNPQYTLNGEKADVTFDVRPDPENSHKNWLPQNVGISASFDDSETLRTILSPQTVFPEADERDEENNKVAGNFVSIPAAETAMLFWFGFFLCLMPGCLHLFLWLLLQMRNSRHPFRIFLRYACGTAVTLAICGEAFCGQYYGTLYGSPWLLTTAAAICASLLCESLEYMNFSLFRPLRKIVKTGLFAGCATIILAMALPLPFKVPALTGLFVSGVVLQNNVWSFTAASSARLFLGLLYIWFGTLVLPFIGLFLRTKINIRPMCFRHLNAVFEVGVLLAIVWFCGSTGSAGAAVWLLGAVALLGAVWYFYPQVLAEAMGQLRSEKRLRKISSLAQIYCLIFLILWLIVTCGGLMWAKAEEKQMPSPARIDTASLPVLVVVEASYSPLSLMNRITLGKLSSDRFHIIYREAGTDASTVLPIFAAYKKFSVPLVILFTKRYRQGIALPEQVRKIDFRLALSDWAENKNIEAK